jgi:hypothetical protein
MLVAGAFKGHLEELSGNLQRLLLEVNHLKLVEEQVIQNQLNSGAITSMHVLVENLGSIGNDTRDRMNEELILCIQTEIALYVLRDDRSCDWKRFESKLGRVFQGSADVSWKEEFHLLFHIIALNFIFFMFLLCLYDYLEESRCLKKLFFI